MRKSTLLLAIAVLSVSVLDCYSAGTGSAGWSIFMRPKSSKPDSITAVASIRGDLSGVFYNPSTLGTIQKSELFFLMESGMAEDTFQGFLFGLPMGKSGLAVGYIMYDAGSTTLYWIDNGGNEAEHAVSLQKDSLALVSYGFSFSEHMSMGVSMKYATSNIAEQTPDSNATCADVGFILTQGVNGFSLSLAGQNIGTSTKFVDTTEQLPECGWCGISYTHTVGRNNFFGIGLDVGYLISEQRTMPGLGLEYDIGSLSLNAGYYALKSDEASMQMGFGFTSGMFEFGYAYLPGTFLNPVHRFNLSFLF